ncbi:MAG TPA: hypothetical protein VHU87_09150 [Rhizomicrobium sp.]|jgi:hypothetical protein|nr:hypothetical protein [Rhizomicrobium sp.]
MKRLAHAAIAASVLAVASTTAVLAMGPTPHTTESRTGTQVATGEKLTRDVQTAIVAAQKLATAGDMAGALAQIKIAQAVSDRTPHDDFVINQFLSVVSANLHDYPTSMTAYEAMFAAPDFAALTDDDKKAAYYNAVIVADDLQQWQKAINYGQQLETFHGNDDSTYTVMAISYYSLKDNANATVYAQKAVDFAKAHNKTAPEQAQQIVANAEAQSNPAAALAMIESTAVATNDPDTWHRLTQHAVGDKGVKEIDALFLYRLQYMAGAMQQGDDFIVMASLAGELGYPTEEAKIYEQGMSSGKLSAGQASGLAKARRDAAADERSLGAIAASAERAKSGEQDVKLAEDYWGYGRYADAEAAARAGIAKGYAKDPSEGQMILGLALVAQHKYDDAIATFAAVQGNEGRRAAAHLWSLYAQALKKQGGGAAPAPAPAH